jgi:hypothetical protein
MVTFEKIFAIYLSFFRRDADKPFPNGKNRQN